MSSANLHKLRVLTSFTEFTYPYAWGRYKPKILANSFNMTSDEATLKMKKLILTDFKNILHIDLNI